MRLWKMRAIYGKGLSARSLLGRRLKHCTILKGIERCDKDTKKDEE